LDWLPTLIPNFQERPTTIYDSWGKSMKERRPLLFNTLIYIVFLTILAFSQFGCDGQSVLTTTEDIKVTSLDAVSTTVYTDHELGISMTIQSTHDLDEVTVVVGLMEEHADGISDEALADLKSCPLGRMTFTNLTANTPTTVQKDFLVHEDCLNGETTGTFNLFTYIDPDEKIKEFGSEAEENNATVFNQQELSKTNNQACQDPDSNVGCIYSITVDANPGIDLAVAEFELESSVGILYPAADHVDVTAGQEEFNRPHIKADTGIRLDGADRSSENALSSATELRYDICPTSSAGCQDGDWMPLTIYSKTDSFNGHDRVESISELPSGHVTYYSHDLYAEGTTLTKMQEDGDWANAYEYTVRACINKPRDAGFGLTAFTPVTEGIKDHDDDDSNNCKYANVILAEPKNAVVDAPATVSSYSFDRSKTDFWGSHSKIGVSLDAGTNNTLDFSGARTHTWAKADLEGWLPLNIIDAYAKANADVSIVGSSLDVKVAAFTKTYFSYTRSIPEYSWSKKWSISKKACTTFSYGIYVVALDVEVCASGKLGYDAELTISAKSGAGSGVFANSAKIGSIDPQFKPYLNFDGSADANIDAAVARAGIIATIAILDASGPVTGYLRWGLNDAAHMVIQGNINLKLVLDTLNGKIVAFADVREVKWCKKWFVHYPCGVRWKREATKTIVRWSGYKRTIELLNRTYNTTLTL
jgi:hypothetical protein